MHSAVSAPTPEMRRQRIWELTRAHDAATTLAERLEMLGWLGDYRAARGLATRLWDELTLERSRASSLGTDGD